MIQLRTGSPAARIRRAALCTVPYTALRAFDQRQ
jgi:hypothetical protein